MRHALFFLALFALPGSVVAQLEFLTVKEIFQAINFLAAHPRSPANYSTVSPFGPENDETRMPEVLDDLSEAVLRCYHPTARYQLADVTQVPWDQEGQYADAQNSALIRIRYLGPRLDDPYEMDVGLVSRRHQIRTTVVNDNSPIPRKADCRLENWTTFEP
jgi:hypothetical protein